MHLGGRRWQVLAAAHTPSHNQDFASIFYARRGGLKEALPSNSVPFLLRPHFVLKVSMTAAGGPHFAQRPPHSSPPESALSTPSTGVRDTLGGGIGFFAHIAALAAFQRSVGVQ
jgi:hypothetical protein